MKKILYISVITVLASLGFTSCSKPGCTDSRATNYNADLNEDDGSCTYRGDITFWCLPDISDSLRIIEGHTSLYFELEGKIVDSTVTEVFFAPSGICNTPGVKTIPIDGLTYESRYYKYRVKGTDMVTVYEDFIKLDANECLEIQLK